MEKNLTSFSKILAPVGQRCSIQIVALEYLPKLEFSFNKVAGFKSTVLLKRDSNTEDFLWILGNFEGHQFYKTPADSCFWNHLKITLQLIFSKFAGLQQVTLPTPSSFTGWNTSQNTSLQPEKHLRNTFFKEPLSLALSDQWQCPRNLVFLLLLFSLIFICIYN